MRRKARLIGELAGGGLVLAGAIAAATAIVALHPGYAWKDLLGNARTIATACALLGLGSILMAAAARPAESTLRRRALAFTGIALVTFARGWALIVGPHDWTGRMTGETAFFFWGGGLLVLLSLPVLGALLLAGRYRAMGLLVLIGGLLLLASPVVDGVFGVGLTLAVAGFAALGASPALTIGSDAQGRDAAAPAPEPTERDRTGATPAPARREAGSRAPRSPGSPA